MPLLNVGLPGFAPPLLPGPLPTAGMLGSGSMFLPTFCQPVSLATILPGLPPDTGVLTSVGGMLQPSLGLPEPLPADPQPTASVQASAAVFWPATSMLSCPFSCFPVGRQ